MAKYKILAPTQLKNKIVAEYGYIADESELHGNAKELESKGFIEICKEAKAETSKEVEQIEVVAEKVEEAKAETSKSKGSKK